MIVIGSGLLLNIDSLINLITRFKCRPWFAPIELVLYGRRLAPIELVLYGRRLAPIELVLYGRRRFIYCRNLNPMSCRCTKMHAYLRYPCQHPEVPCSDLAALFDGHPNPEACWSGRN